MEWKNELKKEIHLMKRILKGFSSQQDSNTTLTVQPPSKSVPDKTIKQVDYLADTITSVMKEVLQDPNFDYYLRQKYGEPKPFDLCFKGDSALLRTALQKMSVEFQVPLDVVEGTELLRFSDCHDVTEYFWKRKYGNQQAYQKLMPEDFLSNPKIKLK